MPRGNDPDAARELAERYDTTGNAEALIRANRASRADKRLRTAQRLPVNDEKTAKAREKKAGHAPDGVDGESVLDVAVRGDYTIVCFEDARGRVRKAVSDGPDEKLSDAEEAGREAEAAEAASNQKLREATEEADQSVEAATDEARAAASEKAHKAVSSSGGNKKKD